MRVRRPATALVAALGVVLAGLIAPPAASAAPAWAGLGTGLSARAYATAIDSHGTIYAGGEFTTAGGVTVNRVAKWNGSSWQALGNGLTGQAGSTYVLALAVDSNDNLYVGGRFTAAGGVATDNVAKWNGTSWSAVAGGGTGGTNGVVRALALDSAGTLYAGGDFTTVDGYLSVNRIASFDGSAWGDVGFGVSGSSASVSAIAASGTDVYIGGFFTGAMGGMVSASNIAKFDPVNGWSALGAGTDGGVDAVAVDSSGNVFAGGSFANAGGGAADKIAKWDGSTWSALGSGLDDNVMDLATDASGNVYAVGYFSTSGATSLGMIGKWNGTSWAAVGGGVTTGSWLDAVAVRGSTVVAGGQFGTVGGVNVAFIARYSVAPAITGVSPSSGSANGGTSLTVTGTDFVIGSTTVTVGGSVCASPSVTVTSVICTTPAHAAGTVDVVVTTAGGQATSANAFTYIAAPTVTALSPSSGPATGGTTVTVTGTGLTGATAVTVGGTACSSFSVVSATEITCTTPAHASGAADVVVTGPGGASATSSASAFTFIGAPTVSAVSPNQGALGGGTSVTVTGTEFVTGLTVTVGGSACATVVVVSGTSATCTTPAHAAGAADVVVNNGISTATLAGGFTYVAGLPSLTAVSPASGPAAGGTPITLTGTEFASGLTVTVGGIACVNVVVVSTTSATCDTPAGAGGATSVVVTNGAGSATLPSAFTYIAPPSDDEQPSRTPPPVLLGILAVGGHCPDGWAGPSWQQWANGGLGGQTCSLQIDWSSSLDTFGEDPAAALAAARTWEAKARAVT